MNDMLRERLWRSLENLPEERLYQVLDYAEFLSSKYVRDGVRQPVSPLRRFSERLEDHMRMNGVGFNAIKGTIGAMGTADRVVSDIARTGKSFFREVEEGLRTPPRPDAAPPRLANEPDGPAGDDKAVAE